MVAVPKKYKKILKILAQVVDSGQMLFYNKCSIRQDPEMKLLTGSYNHTVDGKNRIRIPAKIKADMFPELANADDDNGKFTVYFRAGTGGCISVYTEDEVNRQLEKLLDVKESDDAMYQAASVYASSFKLIESDPQGRLVIPPEFKEYAGIDKEIVICGNIKHVDIWSQERHLEYIKNSLNLTSAIKKLGL